MKIIFFSLLLLFFNAIEINAQECKTPCPYYSDFVKMAQADTVKNTQTKLNYYRAAIVAARDCHCPELEQRAYDQIDTLFIIVEAEKRKAEIQSKTIWQQQNNINEALNNANKANIKNRKIINSMDFYNEEFALAFKNGKYGFINKIGETKIEFSYDKGEPFNKKTGFAKMERGVVKYLIDTVGNEYKLIRISEVLKDVGNVERFVYQEDIKWLESIANNKRNALTLLEEEIIDYENKIKRDSIALEKEKNEALKAYRATQIQVEKEALSLAHSKLKQYQKKKQTEVGNRLNELRIKLDTIEANLKVANDQFLNVLKDGNQTLALDFSKQYNLDIIGVLQNIASDEFISNKVGLLFLNETTLNKVPSFISEFKNVEQVNLNKTIIQALPESFKELKELVRLDLSNTQISKLPKDIGNLTALKYLDLLGTPLKKLPLSFSKLKNLELLDLGGTKIKIFPESVLELSELKEFHCPPLVEEIPINISNLTNLEILDLGNTYVSNLPESIGQLHNLKVFNVPINLKELPASISNLIYLETLNLSRTRLTRLSETIGQLQNLKILELPSSLKEVPVSIFNLKNLEMLNLESVRIKKLPETIGELANLKVLNCPKLLEGLPASICKLNKLERLDLEWTELRKLPEIVGGLANLRHLILPVYLTEFPPSISRLKSLELLDLKETKIRSLPNFVGELQSLKKLRLPISLQRIDFDISKLKNLEVLDYQIKNLKILPEGISQLSKLKVLYVPSSIEQLPKSFTQLKNLEELYLSHTKIKVLPENFEVLTKLQVLILSYSAIEDFSKKIWNLPQLTTLDLTGTNIKDLSQIGKLTNLTDLTLTGTDIDKIPISINKLTNLEHLDLLYMQNIKNLPDMSELKKLRKFYFNLPKGKDRLALKEKLEALKKTLPYCEFVIH